ncbi:MAG: hypothetical protein KDD22_09015, partial [Bdellovibrionales bacterium]|nr:hypothetical protein [Bdellovibrionales bacterium]
MGPRLRVTDMPGYGYAARSHKERDAWAQMVESYLKERENLVGILLVMDGRRNWQEEESQIFEFCQTYDVELALVLTKLDKMTQSERVRSQRRLKEELGPLPVFWVSNLKKKGHREVESFIFGTWLAEGGPEEGNS